jgi:hypothetical protein
LDSASQQHPEHYQLEKDIMKRFSQVFAVVAVAALAAPTCALAHGSHDSSLEKKKAIAPLVDKVRVATAKYLDINVALHEGWFPATPCVSGPNSGAMGVHMLLASRLDGVLNASEPELLIYEPLPDGSSRLVGAEFIVLAGDWTGKGTPAVDGHLTNYVGAPNRYGLPAFYELHVWAWEDNPNGSFADWNSQVTCDNQRP